ncbi:hypothetical protein HIM_11534 [Hirsutella minnesotensis 3608]|uniref:LSM domain-containing protein n=1 Tax=Hirsutella minnesotensis 3608 TaxID=1043627 RepID=A0A0F8A125_9HYPO|nr:hypothetical protein HIM_11534 [Hirsutella minnesotensis 3608]
MAGKRHSASPNPDITQTQQPFATDRLQHNLAMENRAVSQGEGKDPSSFLSDIIGNPVIVKLNSGVVYKGNEYRLAADNDMITHLSLPWRLDIYQ